MYMSRVLPEEAKAREMAQEQRRQQQELPLCSERWFQIAILLHCLGLRKSTRTREERMRKDEDGIEGDDGDIDAWTEAISDPYPWH
jgi:hypothetical protein